MFYKKNIVLELLLIIQLKLNLKKISLSKKKT